MCPWSTMSEREGLPPCSGGDIPTSCMLRRLQCLHEPLALSSNLCRDRCRLPLPILAEQFSVKDDVDALLGQGIGLHGCTAASKLRCCRVERSSCR